MKIAKIILIAAVIVTLSACQTNPVLSESKISIAPEKIQNLVINMEPNLYYQYKGMDYLDTIKSAVEKRFQRSGYETRVVEVSVGKVDEGQLKDALLSLKPSHIFRMTNISAFSVNGTVQNITWSVEVFQKGENSAVESKGTAKDATPKPSSASFKLIYKFNIQSDFCSGFIRNMRAVSCATDFAETIDNTLKKNGIQ